MAKRWHDPPGTVANFIARRITSFLVKFSSDLQILNAGQHQHPCPQTVWEVLKQEEEPQVPLEEPPFVQNPSQQL